MVAQMAWEKRQNSGFYYYRSYKLGAKVKKQYLGRGPLAEAAAENDIAAREERIRQRETKAQALQAIEERTETMESPLVVLDDLCNHLVHAELEGAGYFNHRGHWRPLHGEKEKS